MFAQPRILIVGCGDIGLRIVPRLKKKFRIFALTSQLARYATLRAAGAIPIYGNLDQPSSLYRLTDLVDHVLYLAPPSSFPAMGTIDKRISHLIYCLGRVKRFIYVSTTGVYGDCQGSWLDETHALNPQTLRAQRRVDAEQRLRHWARHCRHHHPMQLTILRVPGIYAAERLPLERLRAATPILLADQDVYTNHIHAEDLAQIVVATLCRGLTQRVYHASDDSQLKMGDYFDLLANTFSLPRPPRITRDALVQQVSATQLSFMQESRRLINHRLKSELGIRLRYATVQEGLKAIAQQSSS